MDLLPDLAPSLALAGLALLVLPRLPRHRPWARWAVLGTAMVLVLRYMGWRLTGTAPGFSTEPAALWMWLILVLEALALVHVLLVALFLTRRSDRRAEADAHEARLRARAALPAVDVLLPSYNEPLEVLERSIVGALGLDWPGEVRVWVMDDQRRPWLRDFCAAKGARWVTRADNAHGKAGNINAWLEWSRAEGCAAPLLMVLDADFIPQRHFLWRTAGFLDDPGIGLVQTPQSFFNPDPVQMNLLCGPALADEQRFFYHEVQPCLDAWGAAFCCGTSFLARRADLDAIGGIPTDTVTEDMMTTYALERMGRRTVWLDEPLSVGLAAEGLAEFINQRARWCLGTVQAARLPSSPLRAKGIRPASRLYFLNAQLYWIVSFPLMLLATLAPAVFWWTGVPPFLADPGEFVAHFGPRFVAEAAAFWWVSRGAIVPILSGVSALVTAPSAAAAAMMGLVRPHGHRFKVTLKGGDRRGLVIHWRMVAWVGGLMLAIASGMLANELPELAVVPRGDGAWAVNAGWSLYALAFLFLALLVCVEVPRKRKEERLGVEGPAVLAVAGGHHPVHLVDLSLGGACLAFPGGPEEGGAVLDLPGVGSLPARVVRRRSGRVFLQFEALDEACRDALIRHLYTGPAALPTGGLDAGHAFRQAMRRSFASEY